MTNIPEENLLSFSLSLFAYCDITGKKIKFKEGRLIERNTEAGERKREKEKKGGKKEEKRGRWKMYTPFDTFVHTDWREK